MRALLLVLFLGGAAVVVGRIRDAQGRAMAESVERTNAERLARQRELTLSLERPQRVQESLALALNLAWPGIRDRALIEPAVHHGLARAVDIAARWRPIKWKQRVTEYVASPDGGSLLVQTPDGDEVWDLLSGRLVWRIPASREESSVFSVALRYEWILGGSHLLRFGLRAAPIEVLDVEHHLVERDISREGLESSEVRAIDAISSPVDDSGVFLATILRHRGRDDEDVRGEIRHVSEEFPRAILSGAGRMIDFASSSDGARVATFHFGGRDNSVQVWDGRTGEPISSLRRTGESIVKVFLDDDPIRFATSMTSFSAQTELNESEVRIWPSATATAPTVRIRGQIGRVQGDVAPVCRIESGATIVEVYSLRDGERVRGPISLPDLECSSTLEMAPHRRLVAAYSESRAEFGVHDLDWEGLQVGHLPNVNLRPWHRFTPEADLSHPLIFQLTTRQTSFG